MDGFLWGEERVTTLQPVHATATPADAAELPLSQPAQGPPSEPCCCLALTVGRAFRGYSAAQPTWGETSTQMQCYYCCGIQNTDSHDLWKKLTSSQAKPVQHPRRRGVNHCPHSKMEEASKSPEKKFYTSSLPTASHHQDAQLTLDDNVHFSWLKFINKHLCVAPDILVGASYTHPWTSRETSPLVKHPGTKNHIQHLTQGWTGQIHSLVSHHCCGNWVAWRSLKTRSLTFSSVKIILNSLANFSFNFPEGFSLLLLQTTLSLLFRKERSFP